MSYPWPSFGSFTFTREEKPIFGSDSDWGRAPSYARSRPLGSATDSIVTLAIGSATRTFEIYLSPARYATLEALVNTAGAFVDWERPDPDQRNALLASLQQLEIAVVLCPDGLSRQRVRTRLELVSQ